MSLTRVKGKVLDTAVDTINDLPTTGYDGQVIEVLGYHTAGDGGGGTFRFSTTSATNNGGTIILPSLTMPNYTGTSGFCWHRQYNGAVSVKWFGAGESQTPSINRYAIQSAADHSKTLYFPSGTYVLSGDGVTTDGYETAILLEDTSSYSQSESGWLLYGDGDSSVLQIDTNNSVGIRISCNDTIIKELSIIPTQGKTGTIGVGIMPRNILQTTDLTSNSENTIKDVVISNTSVGIYMQSGPDVGGADSGCWYNSISDVYLNDCVTGIKLAPPSNASSPCNRNRFYNVHINGVANANKGIVITSGDTNKFIACSFEGITNGTAPTAITIDSACPSSGLDNNGNMFIGCDVEACTLQIKNENSRTEFYGCTGINYLESIWTAQPGVYISTDASLMPNKVAGIVLDNIGSNWGDIGCISFGQTPNKSIGDKGYQWTDYPITTSNTTNITSVLEYRSQFRSIGNYVDWTCRFVFQATSTGAITIELPVTPDNHDIVFSTIPPMTFIVTVYNGSTQEIVSASFSNHTVSPSIISLSHSSNFNTSGNFNMVWFQISYKRP